METYSQPRFFAWYLLFFAILFSCRTSCVFAEEVEFLELLDASSPSQMAVETLCKGGTCAISWTDAEGKVHETIATCNGEGVQCDEDEGCKCKCKSTGGGVKGTNVCVPPVKKEGGIAGTAY